MARRVIVILLSCLFLSGCALMPWNWGDEEDKAIEAPVPSAPPPALTTCWDGSVVSADEMCPPPEPPPPPPPPPPAQKVCWDGSVVAEGGKCSLEPATPTNPSTIIAVDPNVQPIPGVTVPTEYRTVTQQICADGTRIPLSEQCSPSGSSYDYSSWSNAQLEAAFGNASLAPEVREAIARELAGRKVKDRVSEQTTSNDGLLAIIGMGEGGGGNSGGLGDMLACVICGSGTGAGGLGSGGGATRGSAEDDGFVFTKTETTPTRYETVTESVIVQEASTNLVVIPPVYKTVTKTVKVQDAQTVWQQSDSCPFDDPEVAAENCRTEVEIVPCISCFGGGTETITVVEVKTTIPPLYEEVTERVEVEPERYVERNLPAQTRQVMRRVEIPGETVQKTMRGKVAYHAPPKMIVDDAYFISAVIGVEEFAETPEALDQILTSEITDNAAGDVDTSDIKLAEIIVSGKMRAKLIARESDFDILADDDLEEQTVDETDLTRWDWTVIPKRAGRLPITVRFSRMETVDGVEKQRNVKTINRIITVDTIDTLLTASAPAERSIQPANASSSAPVFESSLAAPAVNSRIAPIIGDQTPCEIVGNSGDTDKFALVISNAAYEARNISSLANTHADGENMTKALEFSGFKILRCKDVSQTGMTAAMSQYHRLLKDAAARSNDVSSFIYYSGHGVGLTNPNEIYVIPTDLREAKVDLVTNDAFSLTDMINVVANARPGRVIIVFDACRDDMDMDDAPSKGLVRIDWKSQIDQLIAYPNAFGRTTTDDGAYSEELMRAIMQPHDKAESVFDLVQENVAARSTRRPEIIDRMVSRFKFHDREG